MFATIRNSILKWEHGKKSEKNKNQQSLFLRAFITTLEDILLWRKTYLSLVFISIVNVFFFVCLHHDVQLLELFITVSIVVISLDAFETWLKYKHRTQCLRKLVSSDGEKLYQGIYLLGKWIKQKWSDLILLREINHTKAFLCMNIIFGTMFVIGKSISGYALVYMMLMLISWFRVIAPPISRTVKKFQQSAVCDDGDIDNLIPDVSEQDMKMLSFELEQAVDEKQSLDYWKPEEPLDNTSDSSENSTSIITNLSMENTLTLEQDIDSSSDSSEENYLPKVQQEEQIQSTLEVIHPGDTWSGSAVNAFWNITGAVTNLMHPAISTKEKRKRVSSIDSSDGFEVIDKTDVM